MVKPSNPEPSTRRWGRVLYSSFTLAVIGGAVAVLGAPQKWT